MSLAAVRIPLAIATGLICLVIGLGAGAAGMMGFGYKPKGPPENPTKMGTPMANADPMGGAMPKGMGPGGPGGFGGPGGPGGLGARGPASKAQLTELVAKLDLLMAKPLTIELSSEQKKSVREILHGLPDQEDLSDEEAKKVLDELLKLLDDKKDALKAAGYAWPGETPRLRAELPNPFRAGDAGQHLKSLETTLDRK
jgi:hypothetical protein